MTNQSTIDKLIEMHMTPMADSFRIQMQDLSMKDVDVIDGTVLVAIAVRIGKTRLIDNFIYEV